MPEAHVGQLRAGQKVSAHTNAYPGRKFDGVVLSIDSRVDPATRAVTVRAVVANRDAALKPGMFLTVDLAGQSPGARDSGRSAGARAGAQFVYVVEGTWRSVKCRWAAGSRASSRSPVAWLPATAW